MTWKKTACVLCGNTCGLEVQVENNRIVKVRPDKDNPNSEGYACRKGTSIAFHQHNADRVLYPLKKVGDKFERVSWGQAIGEISEKLKSILEQHGPRSLASLVGGGEFGYGGYGIPYCVRLVRRLGSRYNYSAANQEFAGRYWAHGLTLGNQGMGLGADFEHSDMLLLVGKNPLMAHHFPQARRRLMKMSKDPERLLVVVDPRLSETAKIADIHLAICPGTDALLMKSMIAIILNEGIHNQEFIDKYASGFNEILPWFADFDVKAALKVCELDYAQVLRVCREFATRRSCLMDDLGILMGRHSALISYLIVVLLTICGRISVPGGNLLVGGGRDESDTNDPRLWRTLITDIPAINGMFPPNVLPEEIMNDRTDRIRAVLNFAANPLRSYADTTAYENAFSQLDLLVVAEIVMSETAALAHYVLPSKTAYESWSGTPGSGSSEVYGWMRRPVLEAEGEQKEAGEIFTLLADAMGLIPKLPESLYQVARSGNIREYRDVFMDYLTANPESGRVMQFIAAKTMGNAIGSAHLSGLFTTLLLPRSQASQEEAARAGFAVGPDQGLEIYQAIIDHIDDQKGVLVGIRSPSNPYKNIERLPTKNGRIQLYNSQVDDWIMKINPVDEEKQLKANERFPLILMAGRHMDMNANTMMRDPTWNAGRRACTLAMNPADAERFGFADRQTVKIITEAGEETIELEVTTDTRKGQVIIPHGFGLVYNGVKYGANVNRLTKNTNRDFVGTPIHRYVRCRVEAL
jgi:anaerobic selenocysteine-containing dehydrogenase